jgi:hypothetical protein
MTQEPKKPEWFEIAESDNAAAAVTKVDKKLTVLTAVVAGGIIAAGAFFANATESPVANAENVSQVAVAASTTPALNATTPSATQAPKSALSSATPLAIANPSQGGIQAPSGRGGDDDDDDERGEHRERGEHHEDRDHEDRDHDDD